MFVWDAPLNTDLVKQLVAVFCIAFNIDQMCSIIIKPDHAPTLPVCLLELNLRAASSVVVQGIYYSRSVKPRRGQSGEKMASVRDGLFAAISPS